MQETEQIHENTTLSLTPLFLAFHPRLPAREGGREKKVGKDSPKNIAFESTPALSRPVGRNKFLHRQ